MPGLKNNPPAAISTGFDARAWAGSRVFDCGLVQISLDADAGIYESAPAFLHGHGSGESFAGAVQAAWLAAVGSGACVVSLTGSDRIRITATSDFEIGSGADWLGFDAAGHGLTAGGGPTYSRTAGGEWTRGVIDLRSKTLTITPSGGSPFTVMAAGKRGIVQSVITLLRAQSHGDADDCLYTLQATENAAHSTSYIRWLVSDTGYVQRTRPSGVAGAITAWVDTAFRDRLGFNGTESEALSGGVYVLTASSPLPGFARVQGIRRFARWYDEQTATTEQTDGDLVGYRKGSSSGRVMQFWLAGPAQGATADRERHFAEHFWPYAPLGAPITVWRHWGDPRRTLATRASTGSQELYDLLYTAERDGDRGRFRFLRDKTDETKRVVEYEANVQTAQLINIVLRNRVD